MKFDWSMVKSGKPASGSYQPAPAPPLADAPRFRVPEGSYPVSVQPGLPLLDFITWCVPDDRSSDLGVIGRLYDSLEGDEIRHNGLSPR